MNIIKGGVTAAKGFKAAGCEAQIKYKNGKKDMSDKLKLKGHMKAFMRWPLILSALLIVLNIWVYFVSVKGYYCVRWNPDLCGMCSNNTPMPQIVHCK